MKPQGLRVGVVGFGEAGQMHVRHLRNAGAEVAGEIERQKERPAVNIIAGGDMSSRLSGRSFAYDYPSKATTSYSKISCDSVIYGGFLLDRMNSIC